MSQNRSARCWILFPKNINFKIFRNEVIPTNAGKKPKFSGSAASIQPRIRQKMFELLFRKDWLEMLDEGGGAEIETLRKEFSVFSIQETQLEQPLLVNENNVELFTFTGTKINRTIEFLFELEQVKLDSISGSFSLKISRGEFLKAWKSLAEFLTEIDAYVESLLLRKPYVMGFSKWGAYLPVKFQISLVKEAYFDFDGAEKLLTTYKIIGNK